MDIKKTIKNLEKNNMKCQYVENKEDVIPYLNHFIQDKDMVSVGGSITLSELGIIDYLRNRNINFLDRYQEGLTSDDIKSLYRKSFSANVYLTGSNAITEDGFLYNVDGRGNRCAAMIYGPDKVLVVAGVNKIVRNVEEAIKRVDEIAAPLNAERLNLKAEDICREYVLIKKPLPERIFVLLVNEKLGY